MSAIESTRGSGPTDAYSASQAGPISPLRPTMRATVADSEPEFQPVTGGVSSIGPSRPALWQPATGATADSFTAIAEKVAFPQPAADFAAIQQRLARLRAAADAPSLTAECFARLYAADAANTTDALFGWQAGLERVAAAQGPLLSAALIGASASALFGSADASAEIERNFTTLFRAFGMIRADARYSAYLTANATAAASSVALTAASAASGQSPTDDSLTATVVALAGAQQPVAAPAVVPLKPETREALTALRRLLDRQARDTAAAIDALHGAADQALGLFDPFAAGRPSFV
ncbi:MAG: hypothetical protein IPP10_19275 [Candidatus Competibacteraceae bacterium]|nr:hypothetical protein [Candidatus Competibacteraceae bacterium]